jgi:hypothetical protein
MVTLETGETAAVGRRSGWAIEAFRLAILGVILAVAYGLRRPRIRSSWPSECWDVLNAIRLHYTQVTNLSGYMLDNFVKSILHTEHGTYDSWFIWAYTGLLDWVHQPITMFSIGHGEVLLSVATVALVYVVGRSYFNAPVGLIAAGLLAVSSRHIAFSALPWFYNTAVFTVGVFLLAWKAYHDRRTWWSALMLGAVVFIGAGSELVVLFPLWMLACDPLFIRHRDGRLEMATWRRYYLRPQSLLIWAPIAIMAAVHWYIYKRVGFAGNNLGMIGIARLNYSGFNGPLVMAGGLLHSARLVIDSWVGLWIVVALVRGLVHVYQKRELPRLNVMGMLTVMLAVTALVINLKRGGAAGGTDRSFHVLLPGCVLMAAGFLALFREARWPERLLGIGLVATVIISEPLSTEKFDPTFVPKPAPLEAVGWYVRTYGERYDTKVFNLFPDIDLHLNSEFWYGKQLMEDFTDASPMHPVSHYRKQIFGYSQGKGFTNLADFAFPFDFVVVFDRPTPALVTEANTAWVRRNLEWALAHGYHRVATVSRDRELVASIYSPRDLPFREMDAGQYGERWGREYGNLKNLFENNRIGLASYWGHF